MYYWQNTSISSKQFEVLEFIYRYRGLTNEHLRCLIFGHLESNPNGQKANISRYTSDLKKKKFIQSFSCHPYSKELLHYLTAKGIEFLKEYINTDSMNPLAGFKGEYMGDFEASMLKPGQKNIEHMMMFLNFSIKYKDKFEIRHNLYAPRAYKYIYEDERNIIYKNGKIRPDGECRSKGKIYTIEIDTGTERYTKLLEKFKNYKRYLDYCIQENIEHPWYGLILVCKETNVEFERDTRLHSILKAACEGLSYYCWSFPIMILRSEKKPFNLFNQLKIDIKPLTNIGCNIPSEENKALVDRALKEQQEKRDEEERRLISERAQRQVSERFDRERREYEAKKQRQEKIEQLQREKERQKKDKKFLGLGKFLS